MTSDDDDARRSKFRGAFLGCVAGDAFGRPFEMMSALDRRLEPRVRARAEAWGARPWRYTDDSEMMIALAESLVRVRRVSAPDILASLRASYDPSRGYGHGVKLALRGGARMGGDEGSKGSGGAVRVVAIACAYHDDLDSVAAFAEESAGVTHAHPAGRAGAVAHALAIACALTNEVPRLLETITRRSIVQSSGLASRLERIDVLLGSSASPAEASRALGAGVVAEETVPLAIFAFLRWAPDFEAIVTNAVLAGGDTDTVAAMSGALCGALVGEGGIPERWPLEGATRVRDLADETFALWRIRRAAE